MAEQKVGLALGGGAARGMAHIGVLTVLEREGIPIDFIAGTSIGAIVGAMYARNKNAEQTKEQVMELASRKLTRFIDPALPWTGLIKGEKICDQLAVFLGGHVSFNDLQIPFACTSTDIDTGEEVVFDRGSVIEAVRASISLPGIFTVAKWGNKFLVDGGLANPVPVNLARKMGASFVAAVNVIPGMVDRAHEHSEERMKDDKEPNIIHVMIQSIHIGTFSLIRSSLEKADVVIEPDVVHIGATEFNRAREGIKQGEIAARKAIPEIRSRLGI